MSDQFILYGATVERSTDGSTWEAIPECKSIAVPAVETDYVEAAGVANWSRLLRRLGVTEAAAVSRPEGADARV